MAWTSADVAALQTALKSGHQTVRYGDRTITYHSIDQMLKLLAAMKQEVSVADDPITSRYQTRFVRLRKA